MKGFIQKKKVHRTTFMYSFTEENEIHNTKFLKSETFHQFNSMTELEQ